jgi:hypothetical protein
MCIRSARLQLFRVDAVHGTDKIALHPDIQKRPQQSRRFTYTSFNPRRFSSLALAGMLQIRRSITARKSVADVVRQSRARCEARH